MLQHLYDEMEFNGSKGSRLLMPREKVKVNHGSRDKFFVLDILQLRLPTA